jgi:DNA mismatch endonuclease (patch repair protein)
VPSFAGLSPASASHSRVKRANRKTDTAHELLLRRALWRRGLRYRKHAAGLPGRPDVVFPGARVAVFCDGDFWHGRDWHTRRSRLAQGSNAAYWVAKIARNIERDTSTTALLERQGWLVLRMWETDVKRDPDAAAAIIEAHVRARRSGTGPPGAQPE